MTKDDLLQVAGDQTRTVDGNLIDRIRGAVRLRVSEAPKEVNGPKGLGIEVEQGTVDVEAAEAIVLRCGACRLEIHPDKIVLTGPEIVARCPNPEATHGTSVVLTGGTVELTADELRQRAAKARTEVDRRVAFGVGSGGEVTSLDLHEGATLRTTGEGEVVARTLELAGTETAVLRGVTCDVAGEIIGISGKRIGIDADHRIEIGTDGQVNIRGKDKISLN